MSEIQYLMLDNKNFNRNSLDGFIRLQKVFECWRKNGEDYALMPVTYTEDWSLEERRKSADRIINEINSGSIAYGAFENGKVIGYALILKERFGSKKQYIDLAEFYVSAPYRRNGTGKELFRLACAAARKLGGAKLYISAHSAKESIAAYTNYGCVPALEINRRIAEKEPFDLQLEFEL